MLKLAPGGHVGRFIIWTESAFKELNNIFGTYGLKGDSKLKLRNGAPYRLPTACMTNTDVERIIQSDEVQAVVKPRKLPPRKRFIKKNPLKNLYFMVKLNPYALTLRRNKIKEDLRRQKLNAEKAALKKQNKWQPGKKAQERAQFIAQKKKEHEPVKQEMKKLLLE